MKKLILSLAVIAIALTSCKSEKKVETKEAKSGSKVLSTDARLKVIKRMEEAYDFHSWNLDTKIETTKVPEIMASIGVHATDKFMTYLKNLYPKIIGKEDFV